MTQSQQLLVSAYNKGYRIIDGQCINPKGKIIQGTIKRHPVPYKQLSIKTKTGSRAVSFHGLLAYQLYGDMYFVDGIVARHLDGDSLNNQPDNIILGTMKDNIQDIPTKRSSDKNKVSSATLTKLKNGMEDDIINDYKNGMGAKQLYIKYGTCINTIYIIIRKFKKDKDLNP